MRNLEIASELRRIAQENNGVLRVEDVVDAARPTDSILHSKFDWEDSEAAHKWRLHQARNLINVVVEKMGPGEEPLFTHVFVSLTTDRKIGGGYRETVDVLHNPDHKSQLLADAFADMKVFEKKYRSLKELSGVFSAMRAARGTKTAA